MDAIGFALLVGLLAALGALACAGVLTAMRNDRLRLLAMMRKRGVEFPAAMPDARAAARRCARCPSTQQCDEWLRHPALGSGPLFCPNAAYVDLLRLTLARERRSPLARSWFGS